MEYFANIGKIKYEGKDSQNPLSFKFYNPDEVIAGKSMNCPAPPVIRNY